jgi:hypothetical protein
MRFKRTLRSSEEAFDKYLFSVLDSLVVMDDYVRMLPECSVNIPVERKVRTATPIVTWEQDDGSETDESLRGTFRDDEVLDNRLAGE